MDILPFLGHLIGDKMEFHKKQWGFNIIGYLKTKDFSKEDIQMTNKYSIYKRPKDSQHHETLDKCKSKPQ